MKWEELLEIVGKEPVFDSSVLAAGGTDPADLGRQLSRWVKSGHLLQLRRGLYVLSERYRKVQPHPFLIANRLKRASYISLQAALGYEGLIPEHVAAVTSVTTGRPEILTNPCGVFIFKHVKKSLFFGYRPLDFGDRQAAFVALPEKALLDLVYLTPGSDDPAYLRELRLQNLERLDMKRLTGFAARTGSPKLIQASKIIASMAKGSET
jgi:predicted transcriptional regulator of viral defense system